MGCAMLLLVFLLQYNTRNPFCQQVKQYMYEANNVEYLDCVNSSAHVGHSHPQVLN